MHVNPGIVRASYMVVTQAHIFAWRVSQPQMLVVFQDFWVQMPRLRESKERSSQKFRFRISYPSWSPVTVQKNPCFGTQGYPGPCWDSQWGTQTCSLPRRGCQATSLLSRSLAGLLDTHQSIPPFLQLRQWRRPCHKECAQGYTGLRTQLGLEPRTLDFQGNAFSAVSHMGSPHHHCLLIWANTSRVIRICWVTKTNSLNTSFLRLLNLLRSFLLSPKSTVLITPFCSLCYITLFPHCLQKILGENSRSVTTLNRLIP